MTFYQYYKKPWHQYWWVRILIILFLVVIILALWMALLVLKEVQNINRYPEQISFYDSGKKPEQLSISQMRSLVETNDDPFFGPENARVVVVEFGDFECPFCGRTFPVIRQAMERYGDKIKFIYRDFPLFSHSYAAKAAQAGECAHEQGKFWEMHDMMFLNQNRLSVDNLKEYAAQIGLDTKLFSTCLDSGVKKKEVDEDITEGIKAGVKGTPTIYFNGFPWFGAIDEKTLDLILVKLLKDSAT